MYQTLKKIAFSFLPTSLIYKNEALLRRINYNLNYKGKNHHCKVCKASLKTFVNHPYGLLCPKCGSLPRTRLLNHLLSESTFYGKKVLHFSPHRQLQHDFENRFGDNYFPSNLFGENIKYKFDIQAIELENQFVDLFICYHVLEHVPDDLAAMKELFRITKPSGYGYLQVPFREGPTIEDPNEKDPKVRLEKFGQEDHLRWYNLDDFVERLKNIGFRVEKIYAKNISLDFKRLGLNEKEVVVKVTKL